MLAILGRRLNCLHLSPCPPFSWVIGNFRMYTGFTPWKWTSEKFFGGQQAGGCFSEVRFTRGGDFCCLLEERLERDVLMIFCGKIFWIYIETLTISDIRSQWRAKRGWGVQQKNLGDDMRYFTNLNSLVEMCLRKLPTSLRWNRWSIENQVVGGTSFKIKKKQVQWQDFKDEAKSPQKKIYKSTYTTPKKNIWILFFPMNVASVFRKRFKYITITTTPGALPMNALFGWGCGIGAAAAPKSGPPLGGEEG